MALPIPRGGHVGGRADGHWKVHRKQAEHGRAVHCDATASGPVRGGQSGEGTRVPLRWWNLAGIDWAAAKSRGGGGETDSISRSGSSTDGEEDRNEEREEESKASGSSGAEWSGASADKWE